MSTIIKLQRQGAPHKPFWRIVVTDSRRPAGCIDLLGTYNNMRKPVVLELDQAKTSLWLTRGAAPSPSVKKLLQNQGLMPKTTGAPKAGVSRERTS